MGSRKRLGDLSFTQNTIRIHVVSHNGVKKQQEKQNTFGSLPPELGLATKDSVAQTQSTSCSYEVAPMRAIAASGGGEGLCAGGRENHTKHDYRQTSVPLPRRLPVLTIVFEDFHMDATHTARDIAAEEEWRPT